jgi:hypothetical protein
MAIYRDPVTGVCRTLTGYVTDRSCLVSSLKLSSPCGISVRIHHLSHRKSESRNTNPDTYSPINSFSIHFGRFVAMFEVIIILLLVGFVYYAARWILGRSKLYCETCHLNTYVDESGWCHNCHRTTPKRGHSDLSRLCYKQEASYRNVLAFCIQMKRNFAMLQATG